MILRRLFFITFLLIPVNPAAQPVPAQDINLLKKGVVRVVNEKAGDQGTGFLIGTDNKQIYIVTASHVVKGTQYPKVYFSSKPNSPVEAKVLDRELDDLKGLAMLVVNIDKDLSDGWVILQLGKSSNLKGGESIQIIGFPEGTAIWTVTASSFSRFEGRNIVLSGSIKAGNSGGPALVNGKVIGLVTDLESDAYAAQSESVEQYVRGIAPSVIEMMSSKDSACAKSVNFNEDFSDLSRWVGTAGWAIQQEIFNNSNREKANPNAPPPTSVNYVHLENAAKLGTIKENCFDDFHMEFIVKLEDGQGAAWALRVKDPKNYYLFHLSGAPSSDGMFYAYVVAEDAQRIKKSERVTLRLVAGGRYRIFVDVRGKTIHHRINPLEGEAAGYTYDLGLFEEADEFPKGGVGFRTFSQEKFSVYRLRILANKAAASK